MQILRIIFTIIWWKKIPFIKCLFRHNILDILIFPARACNKYYNINEKDIHYVNVLKSDQSSNVVNQQCIRKIPYAFLENQNFKNSQNYMIYFHGNGETIDESADFLRLLMRRLKFHSFLIEYPKYGIYNYDTISAKLILEDSIQAYQAIKEKYKLDDSQIILCGRSIGTGPAIHVATQFKSKGLIIISPYKSIRQIVSKFLFGFGYIVSKFMKERFNNEQKITNVQCPVLFIHGVEDSLIPSEHSISLSRKLNNLNKEFRVELFPRMNHNNIQSFEYEISEKIAFYFKDLNKGGLNN